tara:strand:- start:13475 stop:14470 length:996 start_codon:yes stop_codon:yes gene_type:complete
MIEKTTVKKVRKPRAKNVKKKDNEVTKPSAEEPVNIPKKRGRKPKGGKIVKKEITFDNSTFENQVIILHLKCKLNDINDVLFDNINSQINYNPNIIKEVKAYSGDDNDNYYNLNNNLVNEEVVYNIIDDNKDNISKVSDTEKDNPKEKQKLRKNIHTKLKELEIMLNNNNINKKSDCFWCTCDFSTHPIHIPSLFYKGKYDVYGCFCSPECAASYLFKENIDNNSKFERYQLLNYLYGKIYNYEKEIKFAPNPYYTLDKYYGNLSIQEYRQLLDYDRVILVIDKPVSKVYPEIHEDNYDFETVYDNKLTLKKSAKTVKNEVLNSVFSTSNS